MSVPLPEGVVLGQKVAGVRDVVRAEIRLGYVEECLTVRRYKTVGPKYRDGWQVTCRAPDCRCSGSWSKIGTVRRFLIEWLVEHVDQSGPFCD